MYATVYGPCFFASCQGVIISFLGSRTKYCLHADYIIYIKDSTRIIIIIFRDASVFVICFFFFLSGVFFNSVFLFLVIIFIERESVCARERERETVSERE